MKSKNGIFPSDIRFSLDIETSGLEHEVKDEKPYILEFALVPVSPKTGKIYRDQSLHFYVKAPSMIQMKKEGKLSQYVENNVNLTMVCKMAYDQGISISSAKEAIENYLKTFGKGRAKLLGKSVTGLDISVLKKTFSSAFFEDNFCHKVVDISSNIQMLKDFKDCYKPKDSEASHTALEDAIQVCEQYLDLRRIFNKKSV